MIRSVVVVMLGLCLVASAEPRPEAAPKKQPPANEVPLKLPKGWNPDDPLPIMKSNCVRCHLTAGRELTAPLRDFARSVHDLAHLSCNDCHGGDTEHDATAHESEHGFIGTKMSAHMATCASCHTSESKVFAASKHYWDLSKRINRDYPVCVDCHGNHDIGRPPADFALTSVCTDCHKQFAKDFPQAAAVAADNDRLWKVLRQVHAKNNKGAEPTPEPFVREVARVRTSTGKLMHQAAKITPEEAKALNERVNKLCDGLEEWLRAQK
jgi:cytochrome c3-like protein